MALLRQLYHTKNQWAFLVDGTARAGDRGDPGVADRARRQGAGAGVRPLRASAGGDLAALPRRRRHHRARMGHGVRRRTRSRTRSRQHRPKILALVHGDTSTTMAQPLAEIGGICRRHDVIFYTDATATLGGMDVAVDDWKIDAVSAGLQKCLSGPPGTSPITFGERVVEIVKRAQAYRSRHPPRRLCRRQRADHPVELFRSRHADGLLGQPPQPPHRSDLDAVRGARMRVRLMLAEGLEARFARHRAREPRDHATA